MTGRMPPGRFDSRGWRGPTRLTRRGSNSGSGSARLDLSQKGGCQVPAIRLHLVQGRRRAQKPEWGKAPRRCCIAGASHVPGAGGD